MAQGKSYHINSKNVVEECRARFRPCPFQDFNTLQGAETALILRSERGRLEHARATVQAILDDPNTPRISETISFHDSNAGQSLRHYGDMVEASFMDSGQDTPIQNVRVLLAQEGKNLERVRVSAQRFSRADFDNGAIGGVWELEMRYTSRAVAYETERLSIDLNGDRDEALNQARDFLRESVIINSTSVYDDQVDNETEELLRQLVKAHAAVEEEAQGPYRVWDEFGNQEEVGTFALSDNLTVRVEADLSHSNFRPHLVERFLQENPVYATSMPDLELRAFDRGPDHGKDREWWAVGTRDNRWFLDFGPADNPGGVRVYVDSPEEARERLTVYLADHIPYRDGWEDVKAKEDQNRVDWAEEFMVQMGGVQARAEQRVQARRDQERQRDEENRARDQHKGFLDDGDSRSTMGKILGMFN